MRPKKRRKEPPASPEYEIILLALSAGLFAWLMRAALDIYFYTEHGAPETLILNIPARVLLSRVAIAASFVITSMIISHAVRRLTRSEARAMRLDKCVRSVRAINQLITRVNDRRTLCQKSCWELASGLGYRRVRVKLDGVTYGLAEAASASESAGIPAGADPVSIPIRCDGEEFGALEVTIGIDQKWDAEESALLREVAEDIAFSVRGMRTSEELFQQREEVQTILDSVSAYISYKDRAGRYIRVNKALADVAGVPKEEWVGKTLRDINHCPKDAPCYSDEEVLRTGEPRRIALESLELPTGTRWVQTDRVPYRDGNGTVVGIITLSVDVTDRMEAEKALACKEEQLRQSQKMEAIGQLAGGIAHDFNNLLTAISGYTELARGLLREGSEAAEMLSSVSASADRAAALTRQLLAFSRKQPLWLAEQDLNEVVMNMTDMLKRLIGEDIELVTELSEEAGRIKADGSQIEQVLMNLAVNARDAMPHGGTLTISTLLRTSDQIPTSCDEAGDFICLRVTDTGCGMEQSTANQIFEPFFTTKRPGVGTGLGLSVVDGIVRQHGGWVEVESTPGSGTTFSIWLPTATEETQQDGVLSEGRVEETPASRGERVLLVEDEANVRSFASRALQEWGYDVVEAGSAEEAVVAIEADPEGFDLVFSDIVLPGKSGTQLVQEVAARAPRIRILLSSGYLQPDDDAASQSTNELGLPLLQKPYSVGGLRAAVHSALM